MKILLSEKKKIILISFVILIVAGVFAGIPLFINSQHPQPRPSAAAWKNLKMLYYMEEQYHAEKGRYAPDSDGILYYRKGDAGIRNIFPVFSPGRDFDYELKSYEKGTKFIATATGKKGTKVQGEMYAINHDNIRNW